YPRQHFFFFFNATTTTNLYPLSLHDALPICTDITACVTITALTGEHEISNIIVPNGTSGYEISPPMDKLGWRASDTRELARVGRSEEHTSELQSRGHLVCRLLLEKKKLYSDI